MCAEGHCYAARGMALLGKLSLPWLVAAFAVGLLLTFLMQPKPKVVIKFPSPYNAGRVVYRDAENTCFKYRADKVACPRDKAESKPQPLALEDFRARSGAWRRRGAAAAGVTEADA
jgi:hypothetical protein